MSGKYKPIPAGQVLAVAWRSGLLEFVEGLQRMPAGAMVLAQGPKEEVMELIRGNARRGYEPGVLLIPGCPEAKDDGAALDAFLAFRSRIHLLLKQVAP
jgi:hypothetical protein